MIEIRQIKETVSYRGRRHCRGVTLTEMIIGIALIGILTILAVPNIERFSSGYKLRGAAREVATNLQHARMLAIKENRSYRVTFSADSYQVIRVSDNNVVKNRSFGSDYPGVNLTNISITFFSRGNAGGNTVIVSNPHGTKSVIVAPTGRVRVQ